MVCLTRLVRRSHRMCTLKRTSLVHLAVRRVHNGVHTQVLRRQPDLLLRHLQLATTGVAIVWLSCKTLRCRRNHSTRMISVIACLDLRSSSSRFNSRQWQTASPAQLARTRCVPTKSRNAHHHHRIVACRRRLRTSTPRRISLHLLTNHLRTHHMAQIMVLRSSHQCRSRLPSVRRPACLRRRMPCKHRQVKDRCRHTPANLAHVPRSGHS